MKFEIPVCPKCGNRPEAILEKLFAWSSVLPVEVLEKDSCTITIDKDTDFDYSGENDLDFDSQHPVYEDKEETIVTLKCSRDRDHEWQTKYTE